MMSVVYAVLLQAQCGQLTRSTTTSISTTTSYSHYLLYIVVVGLLFLLVVIVVVVGSSNTTTSTTFHDVRGVCCVVTGTTISNAIITVFNAISTRTSTTVMTYLSNLSKVYFDT